MSIKKINVLFGTEEKILEIDLQEYNTYESFLKKINEEFKMSDNQIMAMNSSEQFVILNADNYLKILNEDIPEGLKLFLSTMVKTTETMNNPNIESSKEVKKETVEDEEDEDFVIENTQINDEINKLNINEVININEQKEENLNINENKIEENDKNDTNDKSRVFRANTNFQISNLENKINTFFDEQGNKERNKRNKYILSSKLIKPEMFQAEKCSICNSTLQGIKYVCCICDNYNLCEDCELYHNHPCFKYKIHFISNIIDTSNFIEKCYNFKLPYETTRYSKLFRKEYDIKIAPLTDLSFCLRPNKRINIPIKILNYSKETINSSQFIIICKNQKNIFLSTNENEKYSIEPGDEYILKIKCVTPERTCPKENIFIELYSPDLNIKTSRRLSYEYCIDVNFDADDDKINMELKNDEDIYCFSKEHKRIALNLMKNSKNDFKIKNIFSCLFENNWDQNKAIKALKKKK